MTRGGKWAEARGAEKRQTLSSIETSATSTSRRERQTLFDFRR